MLELSEMIREIKKYNSTGTNRIQLLVNGVKYNIKQVYLEDYSDGDSCMVIEGEDK